MKFENSGFTSTLTDKTLQIEISIENLIYAFEYAPNNSEGLEIKKDKQKEFVEFVAQHIVEECDSETGDTPLTDAFDKVFDLLFEGYEDGEEFIEEGEEK